MTMHRERVALSAIVCIMISSLITPSTCAEDWHFTGPNVASGHCGTWTDINKDGTNTFEALSCGLLIDGNNATCAGPEGDTMTWGLYFDKEFIMKGIRIYPTSNLTNRDRLKYFYISGYTNRTFEYLWDDKAARLPFYQNDVISIPLPGNTIYDRVFISHYMYENRPIEDKDTAPTLCEVQFFAVSCDLRSVWISRGLAVFTNDSESLLTPSYVSPGAEVTFWCDPPEDYVLTGSETLVCESDNTFNGSIPSCEYRSVPIDDIDDDGNIYVWIGIFAVVLLVVIAVVVIHRIVSRRADSNIEQKKPTTEISKRDRQDEASRHQFQAMDGTSIEAPAAQLYDEIDNPYYKNKNPNSAPNYTTNNCVNNQRHEEENYYTDIPNYNSVEGDGVIGSMSEDKRHGKGLISMQYVNHTNDVHPDQDNGMEHGLDSGVQFKSYDQEQQHQNDVDEYLTPVNSELRDYEAVDHTSTAVEHEYSAMQ